jgi:transposase-like protein
MSPKKITDADKLEIVALYRQTRDTAAALATRYGVSNSTIGRLLKTSIPEAEYELLIQQKRGARGSKDDDLVGMVAAGPVSQPDIELERNVLAERVEKDRDPSLEIEATASIGDREDAASLLAQTVAPSDSIDTHMEEKSSTSSTPTPHQLDPQPQEQNASKRLVRRRSSTRIEDSTPAAAEIASRDKAELDRREPASAARISSGQTSLLPDLVPTAAETSSPKRAPQPPILPDLNPNREDRSSEPVDEMAIDDDNEEESEDVNALAAMFGEEIADGEDDDEDDDEETPTPDRADNRDLLLTGNNTYLQVTPLSQAILPRTCYIAIDKFAEPVVRPLKDFAELGQIPAEEIQQRTLPVFDNHRIAKRFANQRTQRVIKIPDSRIFQKTIGHMRSKGIARLLVDGNIYSLN